MLHQLAPARTIPTDVLLVCALLHLFTTTYLLHRHPCLELARPAPRPYLPLTTVVRPRHSSDEVPRPIHPLSRMAGSGNFVVSQQRDG